MSIPSFLAQHIDALISGSAGLLVSFYGYRPTPPSRVPTPNQHRATRIFRICGPLLLLFGLFSFFVGSTDLPSWSRRSTSDGLASAEFPGSPEAKEQTDTQNGVSVSRKSLVYNMPQKDIALFLSFSPIPPGGPNLPDTERFAGMKANFLQQGYTILRESPLGLGESTGIALDVQRDSGKVRVWTRIVIVSGRAYRVVASSAGSHHDDPVIDHFLDSFRIERNGACFSRTLPGD